MCTLLNYGTVGLETFSKMANVKVPSVSWRPAKSEIDVSVCECQGFTELSWNFIRPTKWIGLSVIELNRTPIVRLTSVIELTQNFSHWSNTLAIEHNRTFWEGNVNNWTQNKFHLVSWSRFKQALWLKNKLCVSFNFKPEYTGKMSEKAEIVKPSVKLTILEAIAVTDG